MLNTLLLATDLKDKSSFATQAAIHWTGKFRSQLSVLHVDTLPNLLAQFPDLLLPPEESGRTLQEERRDQKEKIFQTQLKDMGLIQDPLTFLCAPGRAVDVLQETLKKVHPDLLVLGGKPHSKWQGLLMGSVGENLLRTSPVPVLVARDERVFRPQKITVAWDYSPVQDRSLFWARFLAKAFGAEVDVVHVLGLEESEDRGAPFFINHQRDAVLNPWEGLLDILEGHYQKELEKLKSSFSKDGIKTQYKIIKVKDKDIGEVLQKYHHDNNVDLLILGGHSRTSVERFFLGSEAMKILRNFTGSFLLTK